MRACPDCKQLLVLPDGYCGHCRQCTLPPELAAPALLSTLRHWRNSEKRHAMIVLGELSGDKDGACDAMQRALHALRIQADKALSADYDKLSGAPRDKSTSTP